MLSDPQLHYLDNAATSRVDPAVAQAVSEALTELWANPSSLYDPAVSAQDAIAAARARVAKTLHCRSDEIYFTACGSEGNNMAVTGAARPRKHWGNKIVVTGFEHPSVQRPIRALKDEGFTVVEVMPGADGRIDTQKFLAEIDKNTVLAACMAVNNETGARQDIAALAKGIKAKNSRTHFHVDAVQAWLRIPIDLQKWPGVDTLSVSGHKIHAPKGIGVLYVRKGTRFIPFLRGGHQERGRRAGTENAPYIVGLGAACELAMNHMTDENTRVPALRDKLEKGLLAAIPDAIGNGDVENRLPNTSNIAFQYVEGEAILLLMDQLGICASSGSACTSGSLEPSHVLRAMGVPFTFAHGSIRFSLSRYTTDTEIDYVLENLPPIIEQLRAISPFRAMK